MTNDMKIYWLHTITPLHVGTGKGIRFIDMPIIREKVTNWPIVPGSTAKGVLRDYFSRAKQSKPEDIKIVFGSEMEKKGKKRGEGKTTPGALALTDAHIVCMPVRSLYGTFAYATSRLVLERLKRDLEAAGYSNLPDTPPPEAEVAYHTGSADKSPIVFTKSVQSGDSENKIFFEDLDFNARNDPDTEKWAEKLADILFPDESDRTWHDIFTQRFAILPDDSFNFLAETGTEVRAHIRIANETKIVEDGGLWYEESMPAETIFAGIAWCDQVHGGMTKDKILADFCPESGLDLQMGGRANVGKGRVKCHFTEGE